MSLEPQASDIREEPADHPALDDTSRAKRIVERLRRLHDGEQALGDVVALGAAARAPLETLLVEREPSGIYQPRVLAARALGAIHAYDILLDFLHHPRFPSSPVEHAGEEAVVNGAAEVLALHRFEPAFETLREIVATRPHLIGVVHALATFEKTTAIPELLAALGDDGSRHAAEEGLLRIGPPARAALVGLIEQLSRDKSAAFETNVRHRHAMLQLLIQLGLPPGAWERLAPLMAAPDARVAAAACGIALLHGPHAARDKAARTLARLARRGDLRLRIEIEAILHQDAALRGLSLETRSTKI